MSDELDQPLQVEEVVAEEPAKEVAKGSITTEVANPALKDYFNMDQIGDATSRKFEDILAYFGDKPEGVGEMLYMIRQLENRLGEPRVGESRLDKVHRYIKITSQIKDAEAERDSLMR